MFTYLIVLLPILYQIASPIPVMSLGELLLTPFMLYWVVSHFNGKIKVSRSLKGIAVFYFIPVLLCFFAFLNPYYEIEESVTVIARIIFYFILIILATEKFKLDEGLNLYFTIVFCAALYLFLQVVFHTVIGTDLPIPANFNEILFSKTSITDTTKYYSYFGFRPASIFTEPSYYADYLMPLCFILLFKKELKLFSKKLSNTKRIILCVMFSLSILLSTSSLGILYLCIVWGFFVFSNYSYMKVKPQYKLLVVFVILLSVGYVINDEFFSFTVNRLMSGSSIGARLYRGFILFDSANIFEKIFGVGLNNIANYVQHRGIFTIYDESNLNYTVTLTNRLLATGLIGTISMFYFWIVQFRRKTKIGKVMLVGLLVSFVFANGEYTYAFPFFFIMLNEIDKSHVNTDEHIRGNYEARFRG